MRYRRLSTSSAARTLSIVRYYSWSSVVEGPIASPLLLLSLPSRHYGCSGVFPHYLYTTISSSDLEENENDVGTTSSRLGNLEMPLQWSIPSNSNTDTTASTTSTIIDPDIQEFIQKLNAIHPQSIRDDKAVAQVLEESLELLLILLPQQEQEQSRQLITESMQHLWELWVSMHFANSTQPRTCRPFQILLETWSLMANNNNSNSSPLLLLEDTTTNNNNNSNSIDIDNSPATEAMRVLQRWYELLAGDLELAPQMKDYNLVLSVFATVSTQLVQQDNTNNTTTDRVRQQSILVSLASEAYETVESLQSWGYTKTPTLETNAYLIRCLTNVVTALTSMSLQRAHDESLMVQDIQTAWSRLQDTMKNGIQVLADKQFNSAKSKSAMMFSFDSTQQQQRQQEDPKALYFFSQALSDALVAAKAATKINTRLGDQWELPFQQDYPRDLMITTTAKSKDETDRLVRWQGWGNALTKLVLDRPERMASIIQFGKELHNSNGNSNLTSIHQTLVDGCEAWQSLLFLYPSMASASETTVVVEIHRVLECLEGLNQHLDKAEQVEAYLALLRCYLWSIKAWESEIPNLEDSDDKQAAIQMRDEILHRWVNQHHDIITLFDALAVEENKSKATSSSSADLDRFQRIRQGAALSSSFLMQAMFQVGQPERVEDLWQAVQFRQLPVNSLTYGVVLKTLADSKSASAAPRAQAILKDIRTAWEQQRDDPSSSTNIMETLDGSAIPLKANHYGSVLVAWSRSRDEKAAQHALQVFHQLQQDYILALQKEEDTANQLKPQTVHYAALLSTLARCRERHDFVDSSTVQVVHELIGAFPPQQRNRMVCTAAMNALARVATLEAAELSQLLLDDMRAVFEGNQDPAMRPTQLHYGNCMHTWARAAAKGQARDASVKNWENLLSLESEFAASGKDSALLPNNIVYLALINSIISTGQVDVGDRAEEVLRRMQEQSAIGQAEPPHEWVMNKVIDARVNSAGDCCGERAEAILNVMKAAYHDDGIVAAKPKAYAYRGVMRAWQRGTSVDKAAHAERLLEEMQHLFQNNGDLEVRPDPWTYGLVLGNCVHTPAAAAPKQREKAVRVALRALVDSQEEQQSTSFVYKLALDAIRRNVQDQTERQRMASALFERCCEDGLVDEGVALALKQCSPHLYKKLGSAFPDKWTRNAKKPNTRQRKKFNTNYNQ